jgi:hypothetical protein
MIPVTRHWAKDIGLSGLAHLQAKHSAWHCNKFARWGMAGHVMIAVGEMFDERFELAKMVVFQPAG